jgi:hypothetical protein
VLGRVVAGKAMAMNFLADGAADVHQRAIPPLNFCLDEFIGSLSLVDHRLRAAIEVVASI